MPGETAISLFYVMVYGPVISVSLQCIAVYIFVLCVSYSSALLLLIV